MDSQRSIDLPLWPTWARNDITLREYNGNEIVRFLGVDTLDEEAQEMANAFK